VTLEVGSILEQDDSPRPTPAPKEQNAGATFRSKTFTWLLALVFVGLMVGYVILLLTLSFPYAVILCSIGALFVWPVAENTGGRGFATDAVIVYLVSAVIGVAVGWATTIGTGLPVSVVLLPSGIGF
jgi:hypothetical protein